MKIKTALLSVTDKTNLLPLAQAMQESGTILYASGGTRDVLVKGGISCRSTEEITRTPEAFQGRMKTLSFPLLGGILSRRGDAIDLADLKKLEILEIDAVVVNFYPFEQAAPDATEKELTELIDIGGPTLVRAAAKNGESVLVLTNPDSYAGVIEELKSTKEVSKTTLKSQALQAWQRVLDYDSAIASRLCGQNLRYGENPHQEARLSVDLNSPVDWLNPIGQQELSYNNVLDMSSAFYLGRELKHFLPNHTSVVIVKHNNPCGVASVPVDASNGNPLEIAQLKAIELAWAGDPVSAFGGVILFTDALTQKGLEFFNQKFVDVVLATQGKNDLENAPLEKLFIAKKKLKGAFIKHWDHSKQKIWRKASIPGGVIEQTLDQGLDTEFTLKTNQSWSPSQTKLAQFGILVTRSLKSNSIGIVHEPSSSTYQLVGAGQGQPNRIDALAKLAVPRAIHVLETARTPKALEDCVLVSDAFFPFKDSIEVSAELGIKYIVQPGGSIRDAEVIEAANQKNIALAFTGRRHFNH